MASIHLPCGCHLNDAFVLGMCPQHYGELRKKQNEEDEAYQRFERIMRGAEPQPEKSP